MSYLHKRGPVYYTRLVVPPRLREFVGKSDLGRSLGVKDRKAALRLLPGWLAEAQAIIAEAEEKFAGNVLEAQEARRAAREPHRRALRRRLQGSTAEMDPEDAAMADLLREQQEEFAISRIAPVSREKVIERRAKRGTSAVTLSGMFEGYASQEGMHPSTVNQFRSIVNNLIAFLGHNDAGAVTHADLVRWLEYLRTEPVTSGRLKGKPRSATTINESYLAAIKAVFAYGRQALLLEANPALEVKKIRAPKKPKLRD